MALVLESRFTEAPDSRAVPERRRARAARAVRDPRRRPRPRASSSARTCSNLTLAEAATIAGVIQSPSRLSPFRNPDRARERRNVVLREMAGAGFITEDARPTRQAEPVGVSARALENEAPYFVDYVSQLIDDELRRPPQEGRRRRRLHHARRAPAAARAGGARRGPRRRSTSSWQRAQEEGRRRGRARRRRSAHRRDSRVRRRPRLQPVPVRPRRRRAAPARLGVQAVRLSRGVREDGRRRPRRPDAGDRRSSTSRRRSRTARTSDYTPANYQNEYDGPVTLRDALAHSRNIVAIKVAEQTGYDRVAASLEADWRRQLGAKPYPSIALGVFEATPLEMATAYTIFPNGGAVRPLQAVTRIVRERQSRSSCRPARRGRSRGRARPSSS